MESVMVVTIVVVLLLGLGAMALMMGVGGSQSSARSQMSRIVSAQRQADGLAPGKAKSASIYETAEESKVERVLTSRLTLDKRLRYAQWKLPPLGFRIGEIVISVVFFYLISLKFNKVMTCMALLTGPLFMRWMLTMFIEKRFKAFDADYPAFLMSLVSLLRTGMNAITALEAAAQGLEDGSLVKEEVKLMLERLRYGVSEDKSIGAFGEDIHHPEIELFVQALLLSRRVGGNLSDTLDRLARQVRKRQHFRESAVAAVGMQRGSIVFILGIMVCMESYLYFVYPEAVIDSLKDDIGWQVWQFGIVVILLGLFWVRQVTKIRV